MDWFATRQLAAGVWLIAEPFHVNSWLVEGRERAVLLDTGTGIVPIRPVVERLTKLPVSVVNTHYHFDHVGGNHEFEETAIHELGAPMLARPTPRAWLDAYTDLTRLMLEALETYRGIDSDFFHLLDADSEPRPLPEDFDPSAWVISPPPPGRTVADGDRIDLGGRELTVLHTPGHTPDGISLLDDKEGLLFGGDTINTGPIYAQRWDSSVADFAVSTRRLAELESEIRLVLVCHWGRVYAEPRILGEIADGFALVRDGEVELTETVDIVGAPVLRARFDRFSIFVPDPTAPEPVPAPYAAARESRAAPAPVAPGGGDRQ